MLRAVAVVGCLSCSDPSEDLSPACRQAAGEFTTFGCAVLAGQVTDTAGHPLTEVTVNFRALRPYGSTQFPFDVGEDGAFRQTSDLLSEPVSFPDTVTVMVTASAVGSQYPQPTLTTFIRDSLVAVLTYSPNGALPVITFVQIQLAIP